VALTPVDIVIPIYNEQDCLLSFHARLRAVVDTLPYAFSFLYVNDGSTDSSADLLRQLADEDPRVTVVELSRNFGHQAALTAGLDASGGDFVISMDGDGQHPPALLAEMLRLAESGYEVVLTQRMQDQHNGLFKRSTSALFYRVLNRIGNTRILPGAADFRLLARPVVDALRQMREYHRFLRGMVAWSGYRTVILPYQEPDRMGGQSKYSLSKMLRLAGDAVFSFSLVPLYIGISLGVLLLLLALAEMAYVLSFWISGDVSGLAPGWSSLMFVLLVIGGTLMITLGFIGVYVGFIFQEVKGRPIYLVRSVRGGKSAQRSDSEQP
jgi:dolichol-phosphate mannosyltransferase